MVSGLCCRLDNNWTILSLQTKMVHEFLFEQMVIECEGYVCRSLSEVSLPVCQSHDQFSLTFPFVCGSAAVPCMLTLFHEMT